MIPSGDFSLYDHVLDTAWALGAIPSRFGDVDRDDLERLLRPRARHRRAAPARDDEVVRHQLPLPRARARAPGSASSCAPQHWTGPLREAAALGIATRPVVLGPLSFLLLVEGARAPARRARPAGPGLRAAARRARAPPVRREVQTRRAVPGARSHRAASSTRSPTRGRSWRGRGLDLCLATYFATGRRRRVLKLPGRRAAPRPRARPGPARAASRAARRSGAPLARRGRRPQRVGRRPRPRARPDRCRDRRARQRPRDDRAVVLAAARALRRGARDRASTPRSGRGWRSAPRSSSSCARWLTPPTPARSAATCCSPARARRPARAAPRR